MDINKLLHFRTVYETENIRNAAELLHITAGALSKSLKVFQDEIGQQLITQHGRGIVITQQGKELYVNSNRLIEELNYLKRNLNQKLGHQIKVGTYEVFSTHFMASFLKTEGLNNITCIELAPGEIEKAILDRKIDFGINLVPFPHEELEHLKVGQTYLKTFCRYKSKFLKQSFKELEFAVPTTTLPSNPTESTVIDSWPDNIERKISYRFNMLETALKLSSLDSTVLYCPEIVIKHYNQVISKVYQLIEFPYKKANKRMDIYLVKRKETQENEFSKKLAKYIRNYSKV